MTLTLRRFVLDTLEVVRTFTVRQVTPNIIIIETYTYAVFLVLRINFQR